MWLSSPYWIPTEGLLDAIVNAALAGVDVRLLMTGWPDKKIAFRTAQTYWEPLLKAGGRVYLYEAGFFHAKSIVVDSEIGAIGTMNLDIRSLQLHQELMVWMYDKELALEQERIFEADLEKSREVQDRRDRIVERRQEAARLGGATGFERHVGMPCTCEERAGRPASIKEGTV